MNCDACGEREAVIHIQQIVGDDTVDLHLCEICANEKGISSRDDKIELSLSQLLTGLIGDQDTDKNGNEKTCHSCGMEFRSFRKEGKLGCPECYNAFRTEIVSLLRKVAGSARHAGKIPKRLSQFKTYLIDREVLKKELADAVGQEDYEAAAVLRDRIRELDEDTGETDV